MDSHKIDCHYFWIVSRLLYSADFSGSDIKTFSLKSFLERSDIQYQMDFYHTPCFLCYWFHIQICTIRRKEMEIKFTRNNHFYSAQRNFILWLFCFRYQFRKIQCTVWLYWNYNDGYGVDLYQLFGHSYWI